MKKKQAIFTIVTSDYFQQAVVLGKSVRKFEKETDFIIFIADYDEEDIGYQNSGFSILDAKILNPNEWERFVFQYNGLAVTCSLKPLGLSYLLKSYDKVIFLDGDTKLFKSLESGWNSLNQCGLSLTPHNHTPIKNDGYFPSYQDIRLGGIFNSGYVGATKSVETFLQWWWKQTHYNCIWEPMIGIFNEQAYLNDAVILVENLNILKDYSYNVAVWNLHERKLTKESSQYLVNGVSLTFFHFSQPYATRLNIRGNYQLVEELYEGYKKDLLAEKMSSAVRKYRFKYLADGTLIKDEWREWLRRDIPELSQCQNPFELTQADWKSLGEIMHQRSENYCPNMTREINDWELFRDTPTMQKVYRKIWKLEYQFHSLIPLARQFIRVFLNKTSNYLHTMNQNILGRWKC